MSNGGGGAQKSKVMAGLIIGMVLGVAAAGFIAWYVVEKNPASFSNKEQREPPRVPVQAPPVPPLPATVPLSAPVAASSVGEAQHYEFYKVLPDKPEGGPVHRQIVAKPPVLVAPVVKQTESVATKPVAKATDNAMYVVQAGSFQNVDEAEKLKAKLALTGMEASVQSASIPGKGVWHRVRLGPYKGLAEANSAVASLKQNGIGNAAALHAQ
jgi:cell division protein FtsN